MGTSIIYRFLKIVTLVFLALFFTSSVSFAQEEQSETDRPNVEAVFFDSIIADEISSSSSSTGATLTEMSQHIATREIVETEYVKSGNTDTVENIKKVSVQLGVFGYLLLMLLVFVSFLVREGSNYSKKVVFNLMILVVGLPSLYFIGSTIYVNIISETKGPVHWHADFQIYACGVEYLPPRAKGKFENKTGTPVLHQHVDKRLHVEGVLVNKSDSSFRNFFRVQGGELNERFFTIPHAGGFAKFTNGDLCPDGKEGVWNVFLYKTDPETNLVTKSKLDNYADHVPSPHIQVPPGDCLIFEFGPEQSDTNRMCEFYYIEFEKNNLTPTWTQ